MKEPAFSQEDFNAVRTTFKMPKTYILLYNNIKEYSVQTSRGKALVKAITLFHWERG